MEDDYMKRGYLLPAGCKDLIDVLRLEVQHKPKTPLALIIGELTVAEPVPVGQLAAVLGQKPSRIIADLMELGVFATAQQLIPFDIIAQVARSYGYTAKKAA
jgi:hypothetical protein